MMMKEKVRNPPLDCKIERWPNDDLSPPVGLSSAPPDVREAIAEEYRDRQERIRKHGD